MEHAALEPKPRDVRMSTRGSTQRLGRKGGEMHTKFKHPTEEHTDQSFQLYQRILVLKERASITIIQL